MPIRRNCDERHIEDEILPNSRDPRDRLLMLRVLHRIRFLPLLRCQEWTANSWNLQIEDHQRNRQARKPLRRLSNFNRLGWYDWLRYELRRLQHAETQILRQGVLRLQQVGHIQESVSNLLRHIRDKLIWADKVL